MQALMEGAVALADNQQLALIAQLREEATLHRQMEVQWRNEDVWWATLPSRQSIIRNHVSPNDTLTASFALVRLGSSSRKASCGAKLLCACLFACRV
jgi:hypothetical protein